MTRFLLGTHKPGWLARAGVPLMVCDRRLRVYQRLPVAAAPWALDSGGFTELQQFGRWTVGPAGYAARVRRYRDEIGELTWAAPQDWMCEPIVISGGRAGRLTFAGTGLTVAEHQRRTVASLAQLRALAPDVWWLPVLQGYTAAEYLLRTKQDQVGAGLWHGCLGLTLLTRFDDAKFAAPFRVDAVRPDGGVVSTSTSQHGVVKNRVAQVGPAKIRMTEVGSAQVGALQVGGAEVRLGELRAFEIGPAQVRSLEIASIKLRLLQRGTGEVGVPHLDSSQPGAVELEATQVYSRQVEHLFVWHGQAAAQDGHCCPDVRGPNLHPRQVLVNRCGGVLLIFGGWPPRVVTDEGTKLKLDSLAVGCGVLGDAFERVDAANANVNVVAAKLVHGPGETLSNLAFTADLHLTPCRHRACQDYHPSQHLQQRGSDVVLQLALGLLECDPFLSGRHRAQVRLGQRRLEPNRDEYESGKRNENRERKQAPHDQWSCLLHLGHRPAPQGFLRLATANLSRRTPRGDRYRSHSDRPYLLQLLPGAGEADLEPTGLTKQGDTSSLVRSINLACAGMYAAAVIDLTAEPLVGLGSVCRRQATGEAQQIITALHQRGITRLHGFGVKILGLQRYGHLLASADSLAWSEDARRRARPMPGCPAHRPGCPPRCRAHHANCANCLRYALHWRAAKVLAAASTPRTQGAAA
jgi:hypothetical protein